MSLYISKKKAHEKANKLNKTRIGRSFGWSAFDYGVYPRTFGPLKLYKVATRHTIK